MEDGLRTPQAFPSRRFHAYGVGLSKTGTTSLCGVFGRYRAAHEYRFAETARAVARRAAGRLDRAGWRSFVRRRDRAGGLELDAASFNFCYIDVLAADFPDARFVFTCRDVCSWLDSLLNMLLRLGRALPPWVFAYGRALGIRAARGDFASPETLVAALPRVADGFLRHWADANRFVLERLPARRSLVVATDRLGDAIPDLARLVRVPPRTLLRERSHLHRAPERYRVLGAADRGWLDERIERHCGALMAALFPGYRLDDFLRGERAVPRVPVGSPAILRRVARIGVSGSSARCRSGGTSTPWQRR
jgi:hypothetical protein